MNETYTVTAKCCNCNFSALVEVKTGTRIDESICPECGCKTLDSQLGFLITLREEKVVKL